MRGIFKGDFDPPLGTPTLTGHWMNDPKHLVGWWRMNESAWNGINNDVIDSSGNGNHCMAYGGVTTALSERGIVGSFDGTDDYILTGVSPTRYADWSISCWCKRTDDTTRYVLGGDVYSSSYGALICNASGAITFRYRDTVGTSIVITSSLTYPINQWRFITMTSSKTVGRALYVDGVLAGSNPDTSKYALEWWSNIVIGARFELFALSSSPFKGLIDDVRIYNYALTAGQVKQIYKNSNDWVVNSNRLYNGTRFSKLINVGIDLSDSISKDSGKLLSDNEVLSDSISKDSGKLLSDNEVLSDSISKDSDKLLSDSEVLSELLNKQYNINLIDIQILTDIISKLVLKLLIDDAITEERRSLNLDIFFNDLELINEVVNKVLTFYFRINNYELYPEYVIEDLRIYGGAEMHFYPDQTVVVKWNIRDFENDSLADPDSFVITVHDTKNVQRVSYDSTHLLKTAVGKYKYWFNTPSDVTVGDWYVKVRAIKGLAETVLMIHFDMKEK